MGQATLLKEVRELPERCPNGRAGGVLGAPFEHYDLPASIAVGGWCEVKTRETRRIASGALSSRDRRRLVVPFDELQAIRTEPRSERARLAKLQECNKARVQWRG